MPGKDYRAGAEFKLRPDRKKKRARAALVALAVMALLESYLFLHYLSWLEQTGEVPGIVAFMTSMGSLFTFFPFVSLSSEDTWKALGRLYLAGLPAMVLILGFFLLSTKRLDPFRGVEYGSARWASEEERNAFSNSIHTIPVADGLFVDPQNNDLKNLHELVVGDTGAGKSFRKVIPDLLQMTGSYVVADVKGTLYRQTRQVMEENGYQVRVLNLKDLRYSNCFNPLEYLEREDEVMALVDTFVFNSRTDGTGQGDQFWEDSMAMLLTSVLTYLVQTEGEEKTFARALELIGGLIVVKGEIMSFSPYEIQMRILEATNPGNAAVTFYKQFKQAPAETLQSILISTTSRLRLWNISDVKVLTARDEMNIDSLVEEKTVLYLILPPQNRTYQVITIKGIIPSGVAFTLGYEYPATTRTAGASISLVGKAKGNYTQEFTPKGLVCAFRSCAEFSAHGYNESKAGTTFYPTLPYYDKYHTVTQAEYNAKKIIFTAGKLAVELYITKGLSKYTGVIKLPVQDINAANFAYKLVEPILFDYNFGTVGPATGNYVHTEIWGTATSTSNKVYSKITVWQDSSQSTQLYSYTAISYMPGF